VFGDDPVAERPAAASSIARGPSFAPKPKNKESARAASRRRQRVALLMIRRGARRVKAAVRHRQLTHCKKFIRLDVKGAIFNAYSHPPYFANSSRYGLVACGVQNRTLFTIDTVATLGVSLGQFG